MSFQPLPSLSLPSDNLSEEELKWLWGQSVAPFFDTVPLEPSSAKIFSATNKQYHVEKFLFIDTAFSRQRFVRNPEWVRKNDDADHLMLQVFPRGTNWVTNGRREFIENASSVFAVNLGFEVDAYATDGECLTLALPRDLLAEHLPGLRDASGDLFGHSPAAARLFIDFMMSLRSSLPQAAMADAPVFTQALLGLLGSLVACGDAESSEANAGTFMALSRYIDGNLDDADLDVSSLCMRFHLSRATLFRLFKPHGGVRNYIQRRRLMACFRALSSPHRLHQKIYDVALDYGFTSAPHLTTLFRRHFGMTPREVREAARSRYLAHSAVPFQTRGALPDVELMQIWARSLAAPR